MTTIRHPHEDALQLWLRDNHFRDWLDWVQSPYLWCSDYLERERPVLWALWLAELERRERAAP